MQDRMFYAAFVGINAYPQGALSGCVRDVLALDLLFREQCAQQAGVRYKPVYYLAPNAADALQIADHEAATGQQLPYEAPTFANISTRLFTHFKDAGEGDVCVFYYSGHGSQTEAPPVFDRPQMETLVCVDSRSEAVPPARDLIDKELAYLLWKTFSGKQAHVLVVMDCCHSGNNTRNLEGDGGLRFRYVPSGRNKVEFADYLGYGDTGFYTLENGKAGFKIPRYVHLAACRDDEKAQETMQGGLFTGRLLEALRLGGAARSYRQLMQGLSITVGSRAEKQTPVAFAGQDQDLDQQFLSAGIRPYRPFFNVQYNAREKRWKMYGGAMHGLQPGAVVQVSDGEQEVNVVLQEVTPAWSWLPLEGFDEDSRQVTAVLLRMANPPLKVGVPPGLTAIKGAYPCFTLHEEGAPGLPYKVRQLADGAYVLLPENGTMPLFRRERNAAVFLENVNKVGNWMAALALQQEAPGISREDFVLEWTAAPGTLLPDGVALHYEGEQYPSFGLRISIHPASSLNTCYIKALYLGSQYSINGTLIRNDNSRLEKKTGSSLELSMLYGETLYTRIPVSVNDAYARYDVHTVTDYLKIIVSTTPVQLDQYTQEGLELDDGETSRDLAPPGKAGAVTGQLPWSVFTFRVQCKR
ncbi:caspase family protein [Chitinophaga alhagiae]|uniref:caspase family protein n=1 Tax=Chitinophaga alhagiae TaxID=2203219 RepID=UPI000E5B36FE|nr:caspase family protein [Chitinophaga alhagiae]